MEVFSHMLSLHSEGAFSEYYVCLISEVGGNVDIYCSLLLHDSNTAGLPYKENKLITKYYSSRLVRACSPVSQKLAC